MLPQHRRPLDHHQVQPDAEAGQPTRARHRVGRGWPRHHQAGGAQHALAVRLLDRLIDLDAEAEIVGGDDHAPRRGCASPMGAAAAQAAWRSRRNWKNSTPSRRRRFIICGLRTISPTMEAIFGARK